MSFILANAVLYTVSKLLLWLCLYSDKNFARSAALSRPTKNEEI